MGRKTFSLRRQQTRAETRANSGHRYYIDEETGAAFNLYRAARSPKNLPNPWDDEDWVRHSKSWKKKRKTKYYLPGEKGTKYTVILNDRHQAWKLEDYCFNNDIPCRSEEFGGQKKTYKHTVYSTKEVVYTDSTGRQIHTYELVDPKEVIHTYYENRQYRVTYWAKAQLDTEKICRTIP